ncbi:MAG: cyclic lactone autoinducer peptide [Lachnospiraceae bacterium]|nr:cyclic lactone autoinducer peptide [Lachnospiraceae bacterium]
MRKLKEILKSQSVKMSIKMLGTTAAMSAFLLCQGRLYEPKMPEKLRNAIK